MTEKIAKVQILLLLILIITLGLALPVYAQSSGIPQEFRGNVTFDGKPPPAGSTVSVRTGDTAIASTTTDAQGRYGYSSPLMVIATADALLEFYVNGVKAQETSKYESGKVTTLNLTVVSSSPSPSPNQSTPSTSLEASFAISSLKVSPSSVKIGEVVTVTAEVKNNGSNTGTYKVVLKVNDNTEVEQTISLSAGKTQKLVFSLSKPQVGEYSITIDGQSAGFKVSTAETSWLTSMPWWMYTVIGIGALLVILVVILLIRRRNSYYY